MKKIKKLMFAAALMASLTACSKSVEAQIEEQLESGDKYLQEMDYEAAIVAYQKAIELDPKLESAYMNLSWIYVQQANYEAAIAILNQGLTELPESANMLQIKERLVPTVTCSMEDETYGERMMVELESGDKCEIYYSVDSEYEDIDEVLYEMPFELGRNGDYHITYYAVGEYGTKGEIYEKDITIALDSAIYHMNEWVQEGSTWYYYDADAYPVTGWQEIDGKHYYFHENGEMAYDTWIEERYLGSDGAMLTNTWTPDGYYVGEDGVWDPDYIASLDFEEIYRPIMESGQSEEAAFEVTGIDPYINYEICDLNGDGIKELIASGSQWFVSAWTYQRGEVVELSTPTMMLKYASVDGTYLRYSQAGNTSGGFALYYKLNADCKFEFVVGTEWVNGAYNGLGYETYYEVDEDMNRIREMSATEYQNTPS